MNDTMDAHSRLAVDYARAPGTEGEREDTSDVVLIGGCGHIGLPLGIALADTGLRVRLVDIDERSVALVNDGMLPFGEDGAEEALRRVVSVGRLHATHAPSVIAGTEIVIVVVGTPIDEHRNPDVHVVPRVLDSVKHHLRNGQLLILRSTLHPGATMDVEALLEGTGLHLDVVYCPERIAEGRAMTELFTLPQIVAGRSSRARERAADLFRRLSPTIIELEPEEAELAKLFTNTWRYLKFAAANQFFMMANDAGLDFDRIRAALSLDYPRAADMPGPGFAAGPCLVKDTLQLAAFDAHSFGLGKAAVLVNESLPEYVVSRLERRFPDLSRKRVAILGMAFKAESDDTRESLSYPLRRLLESAAAGVRCSDPHVTTDPTLVPLEEAVEWADILVIAAPHRAYSRLVTDKPVADIWNMLGHGTAV